MRGSKIGGQDELESYLPKTKMGQVDKEKMMQIRNEITDLYFANYNIPLAAQDSLYESTTNDGQGLDSSRFDPQEEKLKIIDDNSNRGG